MKYIAIVLLAFVAMNVTAQEKKTAQVIKSVSVEKNVATKTVSKENKAIYVSSGTKTVQPERTVEYLNNVIEALNNKIEYIKSDPTENEKAIETGWYDEMDQLLLKAKEERIRLQNQKK